MSFVSEFEELLNESKNTLYYFLNNELNLDACSRFQDLLIETYRNNGNVFVCGNGGSHADALHFAEELTGKFDAPRRPFGCLALGEATHTTCTSNDLGFAEVFKRQFQALARPKDLLIVLSTSGNSSNVLSVVTAAREIGVKTVGLLGRDGGLAKDLVHVPIVVESKSSARIQEIHMTILHTTVELLEREFFPEVV